MSDPEPRTRTVEQIAVDLLRCALSWQPDVMLLGNVRAAELAALAMSRITCCPKCGAEAWVNIDCDLCLLCSCLERSEET